ncbi:MAG: hypothetical protein AB1403_10895 [Candidatus Riflebacteria bacterium]
MKIDEKDFRCICFSSADCAKCRIPATDLKTLKACYEAIKAGQVAAGKTVLKMVEARIKKLEKLEQ